MARRRLKGLVGSGPARAVIAWAGALYIRLVWRMVHWRVVGQEHFDAAIDDEPRVIAALWHGRLFLTPALAPPRRRIVAMISRNRDGDLITGIVGRFDIDTVRGSSYDREKRRDKGGAEAFADAEARLRAGAVVAMTPDGPRGPRMHAQGGAAALSLATGAPVVPLSFSTARGRVLDSWDRFLLPWPWGAGAIVYGAPMRPGATPETSDPDRFTAAIEAALTEVQNQADAMVGRRPVDAAPR